MLFWYILVYLSVLPQCCVVFFNGGPWDAVTFHQKAHEGGLRWGNSREEAGGRMRGAWSLELHL